ncbi:MAG: zinc-regulated TonB-dependent outer membrane receptor [Deltaproteobacteria bacterium]|nr:zinc-regulated TonB-dependent outer membrane receptor [Deltaproteobacteria bacterium]
MKPSNLLLLAISLLPAGAFAQSGDEPIPLTLDEAGALDEALAAEVPNSPYRWASTGVALDQAFILDVTAAAFDGERAEGGGHDPAGNGFTLQGLEWAVGSNIDPFFRIDANIVFMLEAIEFEEGYATTTALPLGLQARAGQFLSRFGRANPVHLHAWNFADAPIAVTKMLGEDGSRGLGAELSWLAPTPWYLLASMSLQTPGDGCCNRAFATVDGPINDASDLYATGRLEQFFELTPDLGLNWGLSAQTGNAARADEETASAGTTTIVGSDLYLRFKPQDSTLRRATALTAEFMHRSRALPGRTLEDDAAYAQFVQVLSPAWEAGVRYEWASGNASDPLDPDWTSDRTRTSLQATYYPSHFSRLRLQLVADQLPWQKDPTLGGLLALEVVAGAHGAHSY